MGDGAGRTDDDPQVLEQIYSTDYLAERIFSMAYNEHSAYPHPEEFEVMRPEYNELDDGYWQAVIHVSPFKVAGRSVTKAGARRAALYESQKTYYSYHPNYRVQSPYPDSFMDREGTKWKRVSAMQRDAMGDFMFVDETGEEDYADIESMLMWDVRPAETEETA